MTPLHRFEYKNLYGENCKIDVDMLVKQIDIISEDECGGVYTRTTKFKSYDRLFDYLRTKVEMQNSYYSKFQLFIGELEECMYGVY